MHGTRDAANFAAIVMETLTNMKFEVGRVNPSGCFYHGDDFVTAADEDDLQPRYRTRR